MMRHRHEHASPTLMIAIGFTCMPLFIRPHVIYEAIFTLLRNMSRYATTRRLVVILLLVHIYAYDIIVLMNVMQSI